MCGENRGDRRAHEGERGKERIKKVTRAGISAEVKTSRKNVKTPLDLPRDILLVE